MSTSPFPSKQQSSNIPKNPKSNTAKVCIRMRPLLQHEDTEFWQIDETSNTISTRNFSDNRNDLLYSDSYSLSNLPNRDIQKALIDSIYSPQSFTFDRVYSINSSSQLIYREICRDITKSVLKGFNCSIFMYGQTTSGKTFTMLGSPNSPGILPCALRDMFNLISKEPSPSQYSVYCSYIEIYNENIHDLLTDANFLKLIDDSKYGVIVSGAKRVKINTFDDGIGIKDFGEENRKYRETLINEYSSRSHTIFQIFIESCEMQQSENNNENIKNRFSCLNLVDLAGSERITEYDPKVEGAGETGYINKSLFVLANVINRLAESGGKKSHIPYRESKLTRLLSQALGGNSMTAIICTVTPAAINYYQTLSTLRFAMRAKNVKLKPLANEYMDDKGKLEFYKNEIKRLKKELKSKKGNADGESLQKNNSQKKIGDNNEQKETIEKMMKTKDLLTNEIKNYKELYKKEKDKNEKYKMQIEQMKKNQGNNDNLDRKKGDEKGEKEALFIDELINKYSKEQDIKRLTNWNEESRKISLLYKNELYDLQSSYREKIKNLHIQLNKESLNSKIISSSHENVNINIKNNVSEIPKTLINNNNNNNHTPSSITYEKKQEEIPKSIINNEIIVKISNGSIFEEIMLNCSAKSSSNNFEENMKELKEAYETKLDELKKSMNYYKSYIENYYRKKIQDTRNTNMDNVKLIEDNLPIMQITEEHDGMLKKLRELYENKLKDLEKIHFESLRTITSKRLEEFQN